MYRRAIGLGEASSTEGSSSGSASFAADLQAGYESSQDSSTPGGAALKVAKERNFSTSDETLRLIAQAAAAAGAAAGCAVVGLGAAAPLCGWVGAKLGGAVYDGLKSLVGTLFGSDKAKKEIERRRRELDASMKVMSAEMDVYPQVTDLLDSTVSSLIVEHANLFPDAPKLTPLEVKKFLLAAGLPLVPDVTNLLEQKRAGTCSPNDLIVPHFHRVTFSGGDAKYATSVAQNCKLDMKWREVPAADLLARFAKVLDEQAKWVQMIQDTALTVAGSLINLASNAEVQLIVQQSAALRSSNAALEQDKAALYRELERRKQYEDYYLKIKRAAAAKRVAEEQEETERYLAAATANERRDKLLYGIAIGLVVAAAGTAVVISRPKRN